MAKPIAKTPVFEGEDVIAVYKKMSEPPKKRIKKLRKKLDLKEEFIFKLSSF